MDGRAGSTRINWGRTSHFKDLGTESEVRISWRESSKGSVGGRQSWTNLGPQEEGIFLGPQIVSEVRTSAENRGR